MAMSGPAESLQPSSSSVRRARRRLGWKYEILLALLPTITILVVLALIEAFSNQRLLFASLASSAFLIYLDPNHGTNSTKTLVAAQFGAAAVGYFTASLLQAGYGAASVSMLLTIAFMIVFDVVHPPAVATALSFAFRESSDSNLLLFAFALGMVVILVLLEKASLWILARSARVR